MKRNGLRAKRPYFVEEWVTTVVKFDPVGRTVTFDSISRRAYERLMAKNYKATRYDTSGCRPLSELMEMAKRAV
jgi:hypothetical protein